MNETLATGVAVLSWRGRLAMVGAGGGSIPFDFFKEAPGSQLVTSLNSGSEQEFAERYGWINRALPGDEIDEFVSSLAHRIAKFPAAGYVVVKERVNAMTLPSVEDIRRDSDLFLEGTRTPEFQQLTQAAFEKGVSSERGGNESGQTGE